MMSPKTACSAPASTQPRKLPPTPSSSSLKASPFTKSNSLRRPFWRLNFAIPGLRNEIRHELFELQLRITVWRPGLLDDRELWGRICQGDASAFDALYRTHGPRLEMFLRRVLGSRQAAEDVTQETFTRFWQHPNGFEPERGTLRAYLFGAGRKRAAEWWRNQKSGKETSQNEAVEPIESRTETV